VRNSSKVRRAEKMIKQTIFSYILVANEGDWVKANK
jgi:hypothetical protein